MPAFVKDTKYILQQLRRKTAITPRLFMECGRYVTGPHGVLVATVNQQNE